MKVVPKSILDQAYNRHRIPSETYRLHSVTHSDSDGYVAVCERLADEVDRLLKDERGNKIPLGKKGDLIAIKIRDLRVVRSSEDNERDQYLKELQTLLYPQNEL